MKDGGVALFDGLKVFFLELVGKSVQAHRALAQHHFVIAFEGADVGYLHWKARG